LVDDSIAEKTRKFYDFNEAKKDAFKIMKVYSKLNRRVRLKQKDANFYIYLEDDRYAD